MIDELLKIIENKTAKIAVIGLGYVGLPLSLKFAELGYKVLGFDKDTNKIKNLLKGNSNYTYISNSNIEELISNKVFYPTSKFNRLKEADIIIICVPTPLSEYKTPDLSYILDAANSINKNLRKGQLVILESTTYPGTTREELLPILEKSKFKVGKDFFLSFSPERIDPGNTDYEINEIPKIISGITSNCIKATRSIYQQLFSQTHVVSSTDAAEATKLLENIHRAVNIALVNEMKIILDRLNIDIWEVIDAASTKPFGFTPYYPGPGLGGHCIPIDPFYLTWKAKEFDTTTRFIELAGEINRKMPYTVVSKIANCLNSAGMSVNNSKILLLGAAYKKNIEDFRESPALKIISLLEDNGARVKYNDNYIPNLKTKWFDKEINMKSWKMNYKKLSSFDLTLIVTDHSYYDWDKVVRYSNFVVDTRNATKNIKKQRNKIFKA